MAKRGERPRVGFGARPSTHQPPQWDPARSEKNHRDPLQVRCLLQVRSLPLQRRAFIDGETGRNTSQLSQASRTGRYRRDRPVRLRVPARSTPSPFCLPPRHRFLTISLTSLHLKLHLKLRKMAGPRLCPAVSGRAS